VTQQLDTDDQHALTPIRVQLYSVRVQCRCGFTSAVVPSSDRHLAWGQAVRHIIDTYGPEF
jgi:hypothetical protein